MKLRKSSAVAALAAVVSMLGPVGNAHAQADTDQPYDYLFDDDYMVGDTLSTPPPLLTLRPNPLRVTLIRPRASFVAEMLKSVETM